MRLDYDTGQQKLSIEWYISKVPDSQRIQARDEVNLVTLFFCV